MISFILIYVSFSSGEKGEIGPRGGVGARGHPGLQGPPGTQGPKGDAGESGLDGREVNALCKTDLFVNEADLSIFKGLPGEPGLDGVPGRDGVDGQVITER